MLKTNNLQSLNSGVYSAVNEDGEQVIVMRQRGHGWSVCTPTHHRWYEVVDYDEDGNQECVRYKKIFG